MTRFFSRGVIGAALIALVATAPARADAPVGADTWDRLAFLTFNRQVQIPGALLESGTYRFRLANPETSRNVLQVLSHDGYSVYATFLTMPDSRMVATDNPTVTFMETPAGVPPAVKSLFWGGERHGFQFVYPKGEPIMTAKVVEQPEITFTPMEMTYAPMSAAAAAPAREPLAEREPAVIEPAAPAAEMAAPAVVAPEELPKTATPLPMVALGGLASVLAGLGIGLLRRRTT
jgi:hypothetical protein